MKHYQSLLLPLLLTGCITTQPQADGSTRLKLSLAEALGLPTLQPATNSSAEMMAQPQKAATAPAPTEPTLGTTKLAGLFSKYPYDGSNDSYPRVAVTVRNWSQNDCWVASAKLWWSAKKSEDIAPFSVCWSQSLSFAINNAANLHLFMEQTALKHSGNVRTNGPKPPMLAIPNQQPLRDDQQNAFSGFIQQLILDTGWGPGGDTNMWIVDYNSSSKQNK